jgi:threonine dehydratase
LTEEVSLESIRAARPAVAREARPTQLIESRFLSRTTGATIALKAENLQRTGSFKLRGALNKIASLDPTPRGVVTASAGNHGQSLAYAARANGISATVFMPERASLAKIAATKESGAEVVLTGNSLTDCVESATARAEDEGLVFVHPYDDPAVIAGQGTLGLELVEDAPDLARVLVPLGGGGLASGVATAIKGSLDGVEVIGVRAELGDATTIADGIAVKQPGKVTTPLLERLLDETVAVGEDEIAEAIVMLLERTKLVVEGAGAVGVAALRSGAVAPAAEGTTAVILSGGNIDTGMLADVARRHETATGRRLRLFTTIPDEPGSLAALLTCLGEGGANLIDVAHVREGVGLEVGDTGVELVMETRGDEHARRLLALIEERGYSARVLS